MEIAYSDIAHNFLTPGVHRMAIDKKTVLALIKFIDPLVRVTVVSDDWIERKQQATQDLELLFLQELYADAIVIEETALGDRVLNMLESLGLAAQASIIVLNKKPSY